MHVRHVDRTALARLCRHGTVASGGGVGFLSVLREAVARHASQPASPSARLLRGSGRVCHMIRYRDVQESTQQQQKLARMGQGPRAGEWHLMPTENR